MSASAERRPGGQSRIGFARLGAKAPVALGVVAMFGLWWLGGVLLCHNPATQAFAGFAPGPALASFFKLLASGELVSAAAVSLGRVVSGLAIAAVIGVPLGIAIGRMPLLKQATLIPFQFLRMISPLSWMPVAVLVFPGWNGAIVFLIAMAAIWPVVFATANGVSKIDPSWLKVARNLRAGPVQRLTAVILPAIAQDVMTGIRLALGVAWIVLVPAEYLGVSSGLGFEINDARDSLDYARLAAIVLTIGLIGFGLDALCNLVIRRVGWKTGD
jgi:NitT/TauT family transport system permease protein